MREKSCGTVPFTIKDGNVFYLLIQAKDDGYCGFPKGHVENGETEQATAYRETWEETSVKPRIISEFRRTVQYKLDNGNIKTVVYFLGDFTGQTPRHNAGFEYSNYLILPFEEAHRALTFDNSKKILRHADAYLKEHVLHKKMAE